MGTKRNVVIVCVAYNSFDVIPDMASSLTEDVLLQLVDNGPDDGLRDWARHSDFELVVAPENLGFGAGCNLGAKQHPNADFYLFLNPDAQLEPGAIDQLLAAADRYPDAAAFGPEIRKPSGRPVSLRPSTLIKLKPGQKRKSFPTEDTPVPSLSGAALFVRGDAFRNVGGFDPDIFLYFEDDDLTLRLAEHQGPLWYIPAAKVVHSGDSSSPPSPELARFKGYNYARSQVFVQRKLGIRLAFTRSMMSALRRSISIKMLISATHRSYATGRVSGAWSMRSPR